MVTDVENHKKKKKKRKKKKNENEIKKICQVLFLLAYFCTLNFEKKKKRTDYQHLKSILVTRKKLFCTINASDI